MSSYKNQKEVEPQINKLKDEKQKLLKETQEQGKKVETISKQIDKLISEKNEDLSTLNNDKSLLLTDWNIKKLKAQRKGLGISIKIKRLETSEKVSELTGSLHSAEAELSEVKEICENDGFFGKWKLSSKIGSGQFGTAFIACTTKDGCNYVVKRQPIGQKEAEKNKKYNVKDVDSYQREVEALVDLQGWKHAPKLYDAWTCGDYGYFAIEQLQNCTNANYEKQIIKILNEMYVKNWVHTDVHSGNILCRENGDVVLIDYGRARKFIDEDDVEFAKDHPWVIDKQNTSINPKQMYNKQLKSMIFDGNADWFKYATVNDLEIQSLLSARNSYTDSDGSITIGTYDSDISEDTERYVEMSDNDISEDTERYVEMSDNDPYYSVFDEKDF